jgi:fructokinase
VDVSGLITDKDVFTTLAFVKLAGSERSFSFARKPGADTRIRADELDIEMLKSTRIFHFGSLSLTDEPGRTATLEAIKTAKAAGALISYDPNYRAMLWPSEQAATERMRSVVGFVDVIKISDEETVLITGESDPEKAARVLLSKGVQCAVVTLGAKGALAAASGGIIQKLPPPCKPVDTTGAGDAFWGAFLYKLVQSGKAPAALSKDEIGGHIVFANTAASISVEKRGGIPSLPALSAVLHMLGQ